LIGGRDCGPHAETPGCGNPDLSTDRRRGSVRCCPLTLRCPPRPQRPREGDPCRSTNDPCRMPGAPPRPEGAGASSILVTRSLESPYSTRLLALPGLRACSHRSPIPPLVDPHLAHVDLGREALAAQAITIMATARGLKPSSSSATTASHAIGHPVCRTFGSHSGFSRSLRWRLALGP